MRGQIHLIKWIGLRLIYIVLYPWLDTTWRSWTQIDSPNNKVKWRPKGEEYGNNLYKSKNWNHLDCWPSGRFWDGFIVPPEAQATIIFAFLSSFDSTPVSICQTTVTSKNSRCSRIEEASLGKHVILCMNSGFSSVPEKMPKNANAARLAISHAVHSLISLYICTLIAPGGWAYMQKHYTNTEE